ncbi:ribosomal protein L7/L12 [Microbacterium sp.]|uniref:ribosomal protein L7/L12 n=1 Tax=Microbacterium sp. TaxID=51671 RepID=UPI002811867C|nr:ribosomal protein L7/L12 [Microbacterium sp.]
MEIIWLIGIVVGLIAVVAILAAALRGMRPKIPEAQTFTPTPVMSSSPTATSNASPAGMSPQVIAEIDRMIASGQRLAAIKLFRAHSKVGLKEAKDRIDHWSISTTARHAAATSHTSPAYSPSPTTRSTSSTSSIRSTLPAPIVGEIDRLMAGGSPIAAIKLVREHTGLGLKESKEIIDSWPAGRSR